MEILRVITYLGRVFQVDHGGIIDALARGRFGGVDKITQSRGHVFDRIDQHNLQIQNHHCDY